MTTPPPSTQIATPTHCAGCGAPLDAATLATIAQAPVAFEGARVPGSCCDPPEDGWGGWAEGDGNEG